MKFCLRTISMNFQVYFVLFPWEVGFSGKLFQATIYILSFTKFKKDDKVLKTILVPDICPLKTETARLSFRYRLKY